MRSIYFILLFLLTACSTADEREKHQRMSNNRTEEKVYRLSHEKIYNEQDRAFASKELYPWENETEFAKITMNSLRCRGSGIHKSRSHKDKEYEDCNGMHDHGLPYIDGEEFVYPVLVTLLNKVQNSFNKQLIVTSGHRCPKHNNYLTLGASKISRYMIGAKVDFYIEGMENNTDDIIERIMHLYAEDEEKYRHFTKNTSSWRNKEISITSSKDGEHKVLLEKDHPIISIEVRYDRKKNQYIRLDWKQAYQGFIVN